MAIGATPLSFRVTIPKKMGPKVAPSGAVSPVRAMAESFPLASAKKTPSPPVLMSAPKASWPLALRAPGSKSKANSPVPPPGIGPPGSVSPRNATGLKLKLNKHRSSSCSKSRKVRARRFADEPRRRRSDKLLLMASSCQVLGSHGQVFIQWWQQGHLLQPTTMPLFSESRATCLFRKFVCFDGLGSRPLSSCLRRAGGSQQTMHKRIDLVRWFGNTYRINRAGRQFRDRKKGDFRKN